MKIRTTITAVTAVATASALAGAAGGSAAGPASVCNWGGTPLAPTGRVTISPGLNNTPAAAPLKFRATGRLAGGGRCKGRMTFVGHIEAGSSCALATFAGRVYGVPGVFRFWGKGNALVHEFLYDRRGNVVGADQPLVSPPSNDPAFTACNTPKGVTSVGFSSRVEFFARR